MFQRSIVTFVFSVFATTSFAQSPSDEGIQFFESKIRPVLAQHCYSCHSAQASEQKKLQGGLFLDSRQGTLKGGESGPAIVEKNPSESRLVKALKYDGMEMPPSGKLPDEVIADFVKWIEMCAPDPRTAETATKPKREINIDEGRKWWSFRPLQIVVPPSAHDGWRIQTTIDQFIAASQSAQQIKPNGPTTKEKLIRRAYFDLIGLPPRPEEINAFLNDTSPRALETVIDGLLESPHYGEKWARHWLDVARYAESGGYEFDGFRPGAFHFRDWVIRSLNNDLPYDQFVRMQLAGDKLDSDSLLAASASGFLVAGPYPGQTTAKTIEGIRYDQLDDMLMTVGGSMLGLTLGCVRCHDHKFDPLQQKDYYALAASLGQTVHGPRSIDPDPNATRANWDRYLQAREPLVTAIRKFAAEELPKRFEAWQSSQLASQPETTRWQIIEPISAEAERSWLKWLPGGIVVHDGALVPGTALFQQGQRRVVGGDERYTLKFQTHQKNLTSFRIDAYADKSLPQRGPGLNGDGSFRIREIKVTARPMDGNPAEPPVELKITAISAAAEDKDGPLKDAVDGNPDTAWVVGGTARKDNAALFDFEVPFAGFVSGTELTFEFKFRDLGIGRMQLSLSTESKPAIWAGNLAPQHLGEIRAILSANQNKLPEALRESMMRWFSAYDPEVAKIDQPLRDHLLKQPRPSLIEVYTTIAGGQDVFLLRRGEVDNKVHKAEPGNIQVLFRPDSSGSAASQTPAAVAPDPRIALANWITNVDQGAGPLLARVMVNRIWQHHFGKGLVRTPNDFGAQGERPTHPELLEWLAVQFVSSGWKIKPLHKLMMLSAVYQQSGDVNAENMKTDPANRFWWQVPPRRLDAEYIRDSLLAVGGNLDRSLYGPSILEDSTRRSVYLRVKRSELIPMMTMFDAPEPTQSVGERISTTVPTQSLAMLNSPFVRQQSRKFAEQILAHKDLPTEKAIEVAYRIVFARLPTEAERNEMLAFINSQRTLVGENAERLNEQSFIEFCQVLFCLSEFIYID